MSSDVNIYRKMYMNESMLETLEISVEIGLRRGLINAHINSRPQSGCWRCLYVCVKLAAGVICRAVCVPWSGGGSECREKRDLFRSPTEWTDLQCTSTHLYLDSNTVLSMEINREGPRMQRIKEQWRMECVWGDEEQRLHYFLTLMPRTTVVPHLVNINKKESLLRHRCISFLLFWLHPFRSLCVDLIKDRKDCLLGYKGYTHTDLPSRSLHSQSKKVKLSHFYWMRVKVEFDWTLSVVWCITH